jgi:2-succinyl-5-enolpyruvyl-6-hydroxy-3-cyclohexene-1-carboxylate synthase
MANIVGPWGYSLTYCNRGVNGIEGSLSVAAGQSLKTDMTIGCIIGDLSFFYDSNALWNTRLGKNLVVLLLNDGGGKIFHKLNNLKDSPALDEYIAAHHGATAEGICASYNINYVCKVSGQDNLSELNTIVNNHLESETTRPLVIEILLKPNK